MVMMLLATFSNTIILKSTVHVVQELLIIVNEQLIEFSGNIPYTFENKTQLAVHAFFSCHID
jgi:hypothetical protein